MRFIDQIFWKDLRLSLGIDSETGGHYLAIPVTNQKLDYEEYYCLSAKEFEQFLNDQTEASAFAEQCRNRQCDDRLILQPGKDRGVAVN